MALTMHRVDRGGARCREDTAPEHTERSRELLFWGCALLPGPALSRISAAVYSWGAHGAAYAAAPSHLPPQRLHQVGNPLTVTQMLSVLLPQKSQTCQSTVQHALAHLDEA